MSEFKVKVHGLAELRTKFNRLAEKSRTKIANKMVRNGAKEIEKLAKMNVPVKTGTLRRAIKTRKKRSRSKDYVRYVVGYSQGKRAKYDAYYGRFVEFGTRPHRIPKKGNAPKGLKLYGGNIVSFVQHPGARARRWMQRAFRNGYRRTITTMSRTYKTMIEAAYNGS